MKSKNIQELKRLMTNDFYGLFSKEEFDIWLNEVKNQSSQKMCDLGNLNIYKNRSILYSLLFVELNETFDEQANENSKNLKNVIKKYCTNYIQEIYSESDLIEAISMFYANCDLKIFDKMNKAASMGFYSLLEYAEMDKTQLTTWKSQMLRECKTLIINLDE